MAEQSITYGAWTIYYDPPPIPIRTMDWHFVHDDYDASWEGEEDGYVSNGLDGSGASVEDCKAQIAEIEEDRGMPLTAVAVPLCVNHPGRPSRVNLDGDELCQECANDWVRGEGQHAASLEREPLALANPSQSKEG